MVDPRAEAVAVLLTDQPGADRGVIDTVVEAWRRTRDRIMPACTGAESHPLVFAQALFGHCCAPGRQGRVEDRGCPSRVDQDRPDGSAGPRDINTWQEYEAVLRDGGGAEILSPEPRAWTRCFLLHRVVTITS